MIEDITIKQNKTVESVIADGSYDSNNRNFHLLSFKGTIPTTLWKFFNIEKGYVKLSMDLSKINFPDQYSLVFFVIGSYSNRSYTCNIDLFDMSEEVHIPPHEFSFIVSPSSVSLRPGEEAKMELQIKNTNAKLNSKVSLSTNTNKGLDIKFIPNST